jgi:hypothetical protein
MEARLLPTAVKRTSVLRRVIACDPLRYRRTPGLEGHVCLFRLAIESSPISVEAVSGRPMMLLPGDLFLGTPGYRASPRWVVGGIPKHGLIAGKSYCLLAESGVVGDLVAGTQDARSFLGRVKYLGAIAGREGRIITIKDFAARVERRADRHARVFVIVGTSPEAGKTTAGLMVLRMLLDNGHSTVIALKATGVAALGEIMTYQDYGAAQAFDCVDFGLPSTHPPNRPGMDRFFDRVLDICLSIPADAVVIECGGDILGLNVPTFLRRLQRRRVHPKIILAARDALGAFGATSMLRKMGLSVDLITGPCTDTPAGGQRTEALCRTQTMNLAGP